MNCAEFQKVLPTIVDSGGNAEEEAHLNTCAECSALVQDLRHIAEAAKLLLPMQDPSPRVWMGIRGALEREGLVRPQEGTLRFHPAAAGLSRRHWFASAGLLAFAVLLLFAIGVLWMRNNSTHPTSGPVLSAGVSVPAAIPVDNDDAQMLDLVQQKSPTMLSTYRENLEAVNAYIRDARHAVEEDPTDMGARGHLIRAYDAKAMLYEMAMYRSGE